MRFMTLALLSIASQAPTQDPVPRNPRTDALRVTDAVYSISEVTGEIALVPDCDGDGLSDLAIARGGEWSESERIDLMSSKSGARLRTLGKLPKTDAGTPPWITGGDLDGDHFPDLIVGEPSAEDSLGRIMMISGREGSPIGVIRGKAPREHLGASLAFLGDLNKDEIDDFAILGGEPGSGGFVTVRSGKDRSELWHVSGRDHARDFNTYVRSIGDLDQDGHVDLLVGSDLRAPNPLLILSGVNGKEIASVAHSGARVGPAGDLDGDGIMDLFQDKGESGCLRLDEASFLSGAGRRLLFRLRYPDMCSDHGVTVAMGDLDGDGIGDIGLGDGNFNLRGPGNPGYTPGEEVDLSRHSLKSALSLGSDPWCAFSWESGCAVVYSGRTRKAIFGVWAEPGTMQGLGVGLSPLPDITGDGWPDVVVANGTTAYAFRGPGPEPK